MPERPLEVADAVAVAVGERLDVKLIDDGVLVPERSWVGGGHRQRRASRGTAICRLRGESEYDDRACGELVVSGVAHDSFAPTRVGGIEQAFPMLVRGPGRQRETHRVIVRN